MPTLPNKVGRRVSWVGGGGGGGAGDRGRGQCVTMERPKPMLANHTDFNLTPVTLITAILYSD